MTYKFKYDNKEIELEQITEEQTKDKHYLGEAFGADIGHCIDLAIRHEENFLERVKFYRITENPNYPISVEFYANKIKRIVNTSKIEKRIIDTSPKEKLLDYDKIAKALGAERMTDEEVAEFLRKNHYKRP